MVVSLLSFLCLNKRFQMINDFLDNLGAQQHEKMIEKNDSKKDYYNSQSEGKEFSKNSQEKESNT